MTSLTKKLKKFYHSKREFDWWVITLLPIIILLLNLPFIWISLLDHSIILFMFAQLLLSYAIALNGSDLILRFKSKQEKNKSQIGDCLILSFFSLICLSFGYVNQDKINLSVTGLGIYFLVSFFLTCISLVLYSTNPLNDITQVTFIETKTEQEKMAKKELKSKKPNSKFGYIKWGHTR